MACGYRRAAAAMAFAIAPLLWMAVWVWAALCAKPAHAPKTTPKGPTCVGMTWDECNFEQLNTPSKVWKDLGVSHTKHLTEGSGFSDFRKKIAGRYMTDASFTKHDLKKAFALAQKRGLKFEGITDSLMGQPLHIAGPGGAIITQDLINSVQELTAMQSVIDFGKVKSMVEIGGGYGRMASLILQVRRGV